MDYVALSFAFSAGAASAFNPCGIAILPSYLAHLFVRAGYGGRSGVGGILLGAAAGGLMTLGFILVFVGAGLAISIAIQAVRTVLPWITVLIGAILLLVGVLMLVGRKPGWLSLNLAWRVPDAGERPGYRSFFLYGLAFAIASLSCTLPIFLVVVAQAFAGGFVHGVSGFLVYALGMGVVVSALSVAVMVARDSAQRWLQVIMPYIEKISSVLIIAAGAYLIYYWLWGPGVVIR